MHQRVAPLLKICGCLFCERLPVIQSCCAAILVTLTQLEIKLPMLQKQAETNTHTARVAQHVMLLSYIQHVQNKHHTEDKLTSGFPFGTRARTTVFLTLPLFHACRK